MRREIFDFFTTAKKISYKGSNEFLISKGKVTKNIDAKTYCELILDMYLMKLEETIDPVQQLQILYKAEDHIEYLVNHYGLFGCEKVKVNYLKHIKRVESLIDTTPFVDLSDQSCASKLIYLNELGIIDYLTKQHDGFGASTRTLSNILSAITGEKPDSLNSALNAMRSKQESKNNPYHSEKTVAKVKDQLKKRGFRTV